jgi:hypothetical protein
MTVIRRFAVLLLLVLLFISACGGGDSDDEPKTLVEQCVEKVVALYEKHDLPFTADPSERPERCREFMEEREITTAAELEIAIRAADKELRELDE